MIQCDLTLIQILGVKFERIVLSVLLYFYQHSKRK